MKAGSLLKRLSAGASRALHISKERGRREALRRGAVWISRISARALVALSPLLERRLAQHALRSPGPVIAGAFENSASLVRVLIHGDPSNADTGASVAGLRRLRGKVPFSYEFVTGGDAAGAIRELRSRAREKYVAYLPAGVVPLRGWLEGMRDALEALDVFAVAPNFGSHGGVARRVEGISVDGALFRVDDAAETAEVRFGFAPLAHVFDGRNVHIELPVPATQESVIILDRNLPMPDRDGGSVRMQAIVETLVSQYNVAFYAVDGWAAEPYTTNLRRIGATPFFDEGAALRFMKGCSAAWIARPSVAERYLDTARAISPTIRLIYDTVDLHFVRERGAGISTWHDTKDAEVRAISLADEVVAASAVERKVILALGARDCSVVPAIHAGASLSAAPFEARSGVLFIGNFEHDPNADAAVYLARTIMPAVWRERPDITLTLVGSNPTAAVRRLRGSRILLLGHVPDVGIYLQQTRLSLAPLRFGAGMKAKIVQSLAHGVPVIASTVAAEGFSGVALAAIESRDDPEAFARATIELYSDGERWAEMSCSATEGSRSFTREAVSADILAAVRGAQIRSDD